MKVAIFTDDQELMNCSREYITFISRQMLLEAAIHCFSKKELLKEDVSVREYDLIYIDLKEAEYQDAVPDVVYKASAPGLPFIIFISSDNRYMEGIVEEKNIAFMNKPFTMKTFETIFRDALVQIGRKNIVFEYTKNRKLEQVCVKDIAYFESDGRKIHIQKGDGSSHFFYGKLDEIEEKLLKDLNYGFFMRKHKSYLVNCNWIYRSTRTAITLLNGKSLPISRSYQEMLTN